MNKIVGGLDVVYIGMKNSVYDIVACMLIITIRIYRSPIHTYTKPVGKKGAVGVKFDFLKYSQNLTYRSEPCL